jgi:hypothetical protein
MSCPQTLNGIQVDCEPSMGGLKVVYIANSSDVTDFEVTDGQITSITMASGKFFKTYSFRRNTASMTSTLSVDPTNGTSVATDVALSFLKQDTQKRIEISALSIGELVLIVQDANGRYWFLGKDMPVMASAGGAESGTAYTDGNRCTITLQDNSKDYPYEVKTTPSSEGTDYVNIESIVTPN